MKKLMEKIASLLLPALAIAGVAALVQAPRAEKSAPKGPKATPEVELIQRGEYLVKYGGCSDCHTPKKMTEHGPVDDESRWLAGHPQDQELPPPPNNPASPWFASTAGLTAWSGPWGISYSANLTPDSNTGLGIWTEEMFLKAMRTGKHMGSGRPIQPPMPWQSVARLTDDDAKAVFAYLKSIRPVRNRVPDPTGPNGEKFE